MQIEISTRRGSLTEDQQTRAREKANKLLKYFNRLMSIQVAAEPVDHVHANGKGHDGWKVEFVISAEHKHDFVANAEADSFEAALDAAHHKVEEQLRRYKEKVQNHKGDTPQGGPPM